MYWSEKKIPEVRSEIQEGIMNKEYGNMWLNLNRH